MARPREHDEATREALLRAAVELLRREGAGGVAVRRVAEEVGVSTRAVYSVFGSKEALYGALYQVSMERLRARLAAIAPGPDPIEDLVTIALLGFRRYAREDENLFRLAFERLIPDLNPSKEDRVVARRAFAELRRRVQRCSDEGLLGERSVVEVSYQFHALCQGLAASELIGIFGRVDAERLWREAIAALVAGLRSRP